MTQINTQFRCKIAIVFFLKNTLSKLETHLGFGTIHKPRYLLNLGRRLFNPGQLEGDGFRHVQSSLRIKSYAESLVIINKGFISKLA